MRTRFANLILAVLAAQSVQSEEFENLPRESIEIKSKLENWEEEKRANLEAEINAQRAKVVEVLEGHLAQTTRSGDLDAAIALRAYIKTLTQVESNSESDDAPSSATKALEFRWLIGNWIPEENPDGNLLEINRDGSAKHGGRGEWKVENNVLEIVFLNGFRRRIDLAQGESDKIITQWANQNGPWNTGVFIRKR